MPQWILAGRLTRPGNAVGVNTGKTVATLIAVSYTAVCHCVPVQSSVGSFE